MPALRKMLIALPVAGLILWPITNTLAAQTKHVEKSVTATNPLTAQSSPELPDAVPNSSLENAWLSVANQPGLQHVTISAYAYNLTTHQQLAAIHPDWQLTPASVMKLFSSVAGLHAVGPRFRYTTTVNRPQGASSSAQPLYLVGGGDPWLEANGSLELEQMAKQVAKHVKQATNVVGVDAVFGGNSTGIGWEYDDLSADYAPNITGLTSERDEVNVKVSASAAVGHAPYITLNPLDGSIQPGALRIENQAKTAPTYQANTLTVSREPGTNTILIAGNLPAGTSKSFMLSMHDPSALTAAMFQALLQKDGVHFTRPATTGGLPTGTTVLIRHQSQPLSTLLQIQNTFSINLMAENLFRTAGRVEASGIGSAEAASATVHALATKVGVPDGYVQVDGSGLSALNNVSARQVVSLLAYAHTQPWFTTFEHSLIHIGRTNQCSFLCGLMDGTAADGRVWLKTGNLSNQWNYAGYAEAANGDLIAFAVLMDGLNSSSFYSQAVGPQDQMTVDVASWPHLAAKSVTATELAKAANASQTNIPGLPAIPSSPGELVGADVIDTSTNRVIHSINPNLHVKPGLLPRLATLTAYLNERSDKPFTIHIERIGTVRNGVLNGTLRMDGAGNPDITSSTLDTLASDVFKQGIRKITGGIQVVQSSYPKLGNHPLPWSLPWEDFASAFAPPVAEFSVNHDAVNISVGASVYGVTHVTMDPSYAPIQVLNHVSVGRGQSNVQITWRRGSNVFVLSGSIKPGTTWSGTVTPQNPDQLSSLELGDALRKRGITVDRKITTVSTNSARNSVIIATMPGPSKYALAQQLLTDETTSTVLSLYQALGNKAWSDYGQQAGADNNIAEPTGLGLSNYASAADFAQMLERAWHNPADGALRAALPVGQLWMAETPEQTVIAGYVRAANGHVDAVCEIANGLPWAPTNGFAPTISWTKG